MKIALQPELRRMTTDFPTAPLAPGLKGAGGGAVEKSMSASNTKILTLPLQSTWAVVEQWREPHEPSFPEVLL